MAKAPGGSLLGDRSGLRRLHVVKCFHPCRVTHSSPSLLSVTPEISCTSVSGWEQSTCKLVSPIYHCSHSSHSLVLALHPRVYILLTVTHLAGGESFSSLEYAGWCTTLTGSCQLQLWKHILYIPLCVRNHIAAEQNQPIPILTGQEST